ncbi:hypothetical protein A374_06356 [Fictibacillus macauensis ZFHKF-1]|uniref:Adenine/guanine phosphoribosyltransferase n=1 Tax=Fictibacillus macauensis ZFHKF-1 TaxID=1196324 RepID=I8AKT9_9BACL|nr:phosphoribosyltransferase family protein [Fictibacillus macauensis]EIT86199.1 hypothetical protein A374_06356 [Fictibacillus macauensis ZFHKF-1]
MDSIEVDVRVTENTYDLALSQLFTMAARKNKKRSFLFVSNVLGKHISVVPAVSLLYGRALAATYVNMQQLAPLSYEPTLKEVLKQGEEQAAIAFYETIRNDRYRLQEQTLFIGFAETATALGHAVFEAFENGMYVHTTREQLLHQPETLTFEEEHSHATAQRCYVQENWLQHDGPVVLVDDEITTGKTALNIIEDLHARYPRKAYTVLSLLDWRTSEHVAACRAVEQALGITITFCSLLRGDIEVKGSPLAQEKPYEYHALQDSPAPTIKHHALGQNVSASALYSAGTEQNDSPYLVYTGRFGLQAEQQAAVDTYCSEVARSLQPFVISPERTLCLGTGEFMYIPMKIAGHLGVTAYHSTTRSPVHREERPHYGVQNGISFTSLEEKSLLNYVYNIPYGAYDDLFLFIERHHSQEALQSILASLSKTGVQRIHLVTHTPAHVGKETT